MEINIIKIGNSKGIRLPNNILKEYEFGDKVTLILQEEGILIKPLKKSRQGWERSFQTMHTNGDDTLLIDDIFENEDLGDWK